MKAQEVWELWEQDKTLKFKCNIGVIYFNNKSCLPCWVDGLKRVHLSVFMRKDWEQVGEWKEVEFIEAVEAYFGGAEIRKYVDNVGMITMNPDSDNALFLGHDSLEHIWYVKEN